MHTQCIRQINANNVGKILTNFSTHYKNIILYTYTINLYVNTKKNDLRQNTIKIGSIFK